ncbi:MAG: potassium-transporting ATPase subunit KdpA [Acidimicrobiales bacterium]
MKLFATIAVMVVLVGLIWRYLGSYMVSVYEGRAHWLGFVERPLYRAMRVDPEVEQGWRRYAGAVIGYSVVALALTYAILRLQRYLPFNPSHLGNVAPALSFNTAVSFVTNTNWQNYAGESTMSYFSQMVALAVQNFASASVGIAIAIALIRGFARKGTGTIGNFWVDLVRGTLYILLPVSFVMAIVFVSQGAIQTLGGPASVVNHLTGAHQAIARGPYASQEVIKQFGTNGGGTFNANSADPFSSPDGLTNFLEIILILAIPIALTYTFGKMVGRVRQGVAVLAAMTLLYGAWLGVAVAAESGPNPAVAAAGLVHQPGGNLEGKEVRNGAASTALFAVTSTETSTGSADASYDSFNPLGGMALLAGMMQGDVTPGGVGSGLYTILLSATVAVFIGGLMIGRTPEYLGKKIQAREVKLAALGVLVMPLTVLVITGIAVSVHAGTSVTGNNGPHGFSEILYAFTSQGNNNGSAFGGLSGNTDFYNLMGGVAMLAGRFFIIIPVLALAGALAAKQVVPVSLGTFRTDTPLFVGLLVGVVVIIGGLTFFPAISLGPVVEQISRGRLF